MSPAQLTLSWLWALAALTIVVFPFAVGGQEQGAVIDTGAPVVVATVSEVPFDPLATSSSDDNEPSCDDGRLNNEILLARAYEDVTEQMAPWIHERAAAHLARLEEIAGLPDQFACNLSRLVVHLREGEKQVRRAGREAVYRRRDFALAAQAHELRQVHVDSLLRVAAAVSDPALDAELATASEALSLAVHARADALEEMRLQEARHFIAIKGLQSLERAAGVTPIGDGGVYPDGSGGGY